MTMMPSPSPPLMSTFLCPPTTSFSPSAMIRAIAISSVIKSLPTIQTTLSHGTKASVISSSPATHQVTARNSHAARLHSLGRLTITVSARWPILPLRNLQKWGDRMPTIPITLFLGQKENASMSRLCQAAGLSTLPCLPVARHRMVAR